MKRLVLFAMLLAIIFAGCSKIDETEEVEKETPVTAVKTETVSKSTLHETISTNGNVRTGSSLEVYSVVSGRIVRNEMTLGKTVTKGSLLAVIDPSVAGGRYALHEVTAPISGTILSKPVQTGSLISPDTKLAVIGDLSNLQISAYIPERFYGQLKNGLRADIFVSAYPEEVFGAKIKSVSPVIDEESRTCEVLLDLDGNSGKIIAGMFADIKLYLKEYENVISVPAGCISFRNGERFVYIVGKNNAAKLVKIETLETVENRVIMKSGLKENDLVVTEGFETLVEGALVNIVTEK